MIPIVTAVVVNNNKAVGVRLVDIETSKIIDATFESAIKNIKAGMKILGLTEVNNQLIFESRVLPIIDITNNIVANSWNWVALEKMARGYKAINHEGKIEVLRSADPGLIVVEGVPENSECKVYKEQYAKTLKSKTQMFKGTFEFNSLGQIKIRHDIVNEDVPETLNIPEGTTSIADGAFYGERRIKKVIIPKTCTYIGGKAFSGCINLEEVVFNGFVEDILAETFDRCNKLKTFNIYGKVNRFKMGAFEQSNSSLKTIGYISAEKPLEDFGSLPLMAVLKRIKTK